MEQNLSAQDLYKLFKNLGINDAAEEIMKILPNSKTWPVHTIVFSVYIFYLDMLFFDYVNKYFKLFIPYLKKVNKLEKSYLTFYLH